MSIDSAFKRTSLPEIKIIGFGAIIKCNDAQSFAQIRELWGKFESWKASTTFERSERFKGIIFGYEEYDSTINESFFYMPALPVESVDDIPEDMIAKIIPANTYAVFTHRGSVVKLSESFQHIYRNILPTAADIKHNGKYDFEWYDDRFKDLADDSEVDIYLPLLE